MKLLIKYPLKYGKVYNNNDGCIILKYAIAY